MEPAQTTLQWNNYVLRGRHHQRQTRNADIKQSIRTAKASGTAFAINTNRQQNTARYTKGIVETPVIKMLTVFSGSAPIIAAFSACESPSMMMAQ